MSDATAARRDGFIRHPRPPIAYVERGLRVSRPIATKYNDLLAAAGFLDKQRIRRSNY